MTLGENIWKRSIEQIKWRKFEERTVATLGKIVIVAIDEAFKDVERGAGAMMTKTSTRSSFIREIEYDPDTQALTVYMEHGEYTHEGVPQEVATAFLAAGSPGQFYNTQIKGVY